MRKPQVGGELVSRGLHPPPLQKSKQHDDPDSKNNAHNCHGRQNLGQRIPTLSSNEAINLRPNTTHNILVGEKNRHL